ncbi:MAG TPA: PAS domain S-box protein [Planctomycetota bacterium]
MALALTAIGLGVRWALEPLLQTKGPYILAYGLSLIIAWLWGSGPALLSVAIFMATGAYLWVPRLDAGDIIILAVGSLVQVIIIGIVGRQRRLTLKWRATVESLRQSEQRLRATFDNAASGITETDRNDRLVAVNDRFCQMLGYTREELLGKSVHDLTYSDDRPRSREFNDQARQAGRQVIQYEKRYLKRDGTPLWVHVAIFAVRDEAGQHLYSVVTVLDLSALTAAEAHARLLAAGLEAAPHAVSLSKTDREGTIMWVNPAFTKLTGYSAEEVIGRSHHILSSGHHEEAFYREMWSTINRGGAWHGEILNRRKDGTLYWEEMGITPLRDENGNITHFVAIKQDITERKRMEEGLRQSEERYCALVRASSEAIYRMSPDASELRQLDSKAFLAETKTPSRTWFDFYIPPEEQPRVNAAMQDAIRRKDTFELEHRVRRADGSVGWTFSRAVPLLDADGKIIEWFGAASDITERKRAEADLRKSEEKYRAIADTLRESDRRKDEFLAVLGHELRNPLAPIRNASHLLKRVDSTDPLLQRAREMIERQTTQMARLIDDLLDVSRISRGKIQLEKESVDLTRVVHAFVGDYAPVLESGGLKLELCLPDKPLWIYGDSARVHQVIGNLIQNSVKFTDSGGKVSLSLGTHGEHAVIIVQDTGIGIDAETLGHIFEPFSQAERSVARARGGLGLGLALVKGITELHGGSVTAESAGVGRGAKFTVRLPLSGVPVEKKAVSARQRGAKQHRRVLIIEDNFDAAESMQLLLSSFGHEVELAHSGVEGVRKARDFQPDVVLCDIGLPGEMDGFAVAKALRQDSHLSSTYMIAMTGYGQEEDRRRTHEAGFDHHLTKPADPEALERLLAR